MKTTPPPLTDVYLMRRCPLLGAFGGLADVPFSSLLHFSSPVVAQLELTGWTVRCTLTGKRGNARWLAQRLQLPDLKKRLKSGQRVTVFEFPRDGYGIDWPVHSLGTLCEIRHGIADRWVIAFTLPTGYERNGLFRYVNVLRAYQTRRVRGQWRRALRPAGHHPITGPAARTVPLSKPWQ
jgi:hypothetical protein